MKNVFVLLVLTILLSTDFAFAQCGVHREREIKVEPHEKSSVIIPEGTEGKKELKKLSKVSKKEAEKTATTNYPGKVKEANLIAKDDKLVWLLEVNGEEGQKEVFIDPGSGEFLGYGLTK